MRTKPHKGPSRGDWMQYTPLCGEVSMEVCITSKNMTKNLRKTYQFFFYKPS